MNAVVRIIILLGLSSLSGFTISQEADTSSVAKPGSDWFEEKARSVRSLLHFDHGISIDPVYYGEVFTNTKGGLETSGATRYQGLLDVPLRLDLGKLQSPIPGTVYLLAQTTHGRGLTEKFIGDIQVVSGIDSIDNIAQISEYWWEFGIHHENVRVRLGKQSLNADILVIDSAADFIHSAFGISTAAGLPTYPDPTMGALAMLRFSPSLEINFGVWDLFANESGWGFSGNDVVLTVGSLELDYALVRGQSPGKLEFGVAYNSAGDVRGEQFPSGAGVYIQFEQLVWGEMSAAEGDSQGLWIFGSYFPRSFNGDSAITVFPSSALFGLTYTGLIPARDEDVVGAGVAWAQFESNGSGRREETATEAFYKVRLSDSRSVQFDVQYIAAPSGFLPDALVVGFRFETRI